MINMRLAGILSLYEQAAKKDGLQEYLEIKKLFEKKFRSTADERGYGSEALIPREEVLEILKKIKPQSTADQCKNYELNKKILTYCNVIFCLSVCSMLPTLLYTSPEVGFPLILAEGATFVISGCMLGVLGERDQENDKAFRLDQAIKNRLDSFKEAQDGSFNIALKELKNSKEFKPARRNILSNRVEKMIKIIIKNNP